MDLGGKGVGLTPPSGFGSGAGGRRSPSVELVQFPSETRVGADPAGLDARMEARVAAVAGAAAEAITKLGERVVTIEAHSRSGSRSGSPERRLDEMDGLAESTNPQTGEADPTGATCDCCVLTCDASVQACVACILTRDASV